ncbi:uncharacterized protein L201_007414 [Kwoniella dendrophila CBS 6074]|uniref:Uncharacterized protein n=1 Tax=Kwoniella dendrophila CBS 6074 TaxID=1295534 RepID=A0AAX4K410_9TREE
MNREYNGSYDATQIDDYNAGRPLQTRESQVFPAFGYDGTSASASNSKPKTYNLYNLPSSLRPGSKTAGPFHTQSFSQDEPLCGDRNEGFRTTQSSLGDSVSADSNTEMHSTYQPAQDFDSYWDDRWNTANWETGPTYSAQDNSDDLNDPAHQRSPLYRAGNSDIVSQNYVDDLDSSGISGPTGYQVDFDGEGYSRKIPLYSNHAFPTATSGINYNAPPSPPKRNFNPSQGVDRFRNYPTSIPSHSSSVNFSQDGYVI